MLAVAIAAAIPLAPTVSAIGPGGWDHLGVGATSALASLNGPVLALNVDAPGVLLVGGSFTSAGGIANTARIATWNGTAWGALNGPGISNGDVRAIAYAGGKVYVGGTFTDAGGNAAADHLAVWSGTGWAPFCNSIVPGPAITATVNALQIIGNTLYVGGDFADGAGIPAADKLVACDLTTGDARATVAASEVNGSVNALTADSNGTLYAGGSFINMDTIPEADHVAAYDGSWHAMGSGPAPAIDSAVRSLVAHGTDVYVGTDSVNIDGIAQADHVARWSGSAWSALGSNTSGTDGWFPATTFINALATTGSLVFAAGSFQNANGVATADGIAYFDGSAWRPIGSDGAGNGPFIATASSLAVFRSKVHVGSGNMTSAGGDTRAKFLAAYALTLPDTRIGIASAGPFTGNAVYSATAVGEARTRFVTRGKSGIFYANIQNDGLVAAAYTIKGTGGARGITVRYFRGATNVTAAVKAGTYSTGAIAARASVTLKVVVTVAKSSASAGSFLVKAMSVAGTPADAVKATVKAR